MINRKKLLFTANTLEIGGIEASLVNLLNNIDYNKFEVDLILEKKQGEFLDKVNKNVKIKEIRVSNNKIIIIRKVTNFVRKFIFKLTCKNKYDFSCCYATYSLSANKLARIGSKNSSLYVHSNYKYLYNKAEYMNFFNSRNIYDFNKIIFVSNESKEDFLNYYPDLKANVYVFNNFIDIDEIKEKAKERIDLKKAKDCIQFVFIGRLDDSSKRLCRMINLVKEINNINLWIIGDGKDKKMYQNLVNKYKLEKRIIFTGSKINPYPYLNEADYFILTSEYEGFPVTYLESLALNKKIITTINTSDESINMKEIGAFIISKDEKKMVEEVKKIIKKENTKTTKVDLEKIQKERIKKLEKLFNGGD